METVRVRVVFDDRHVLSKSQKSEGLKRCWLLLKPELTTISDLASHLLHSFFLQCSCPNGLVLSMDEFVLPSFESTGIFKDKDIIRVRRKGGTLAEVIKVGDDANHAEDAKVVEKQPLLLCDKLLAIEEFGKESGGDKSEDTDDQPEVVCLKDPSSIETTSKRKRKHSDKHLGSKRKKTKSSSPEKCPVISSEGTEDIHLKQNESRPQKGGVSKKSLRRKGGSTNGDGRSDAVISSEVNGTIKNTFGSASKEEGHDKVHEICQGNVGEAHVYGNTEKIPSRSARRKKAKRQWRRELANSQNKELNQNHMPERNMHQASPEYEKQDLDNDVEEESVPIVVRPGHIRFEPLEQSKEQLPDPVGILQWNGTTNKKKGQKWGRENNFVCKSGEDNASHAECNGKSIAEEGELVPNPIDFEKLVPLTCLPQEGDVIAYRFVELSSSWCPELSSFRVGKVSSYDSASMKVILMPVPEYPIFSDEKSGEDESTVQPNLSLYKEDGSLEIDFPSLVDARILNVDKSDTTTPITRRESTDEGAPDGMELNIRARADQNPKEIVAPLTEKTQDRGWDEISRALNEKKAQLLQENGWNNCTTKEKSTNTSWSYRALRGSGLGPTISLLRAKKDL